MQERVEDTFEVNGALLDAHLLVAGAERTSLCQDVVGGVLMEGRRLSATHESLLIEYVLNDVLLSGPHGGAGLCSFVLREDFRALRRLRPALVVFSFVARCRRGWSHRRLEMRVQISRLVIRRSLFGAEAMRAGLQLASRTFLLQRLIDGGSTRFLVLHVESRRTTLKARSINLRDLSPL